MTRRLENGADLRGPLQIAGAAGTSGQVLTSAGTGAIPTWSAPGGFSGGTLTSNLTVAAGTASLAPLRFQSGTNLTSATTGAMEYDGKVLYSTPVERGVSPSMMFYRLNSGRVGSNFSLAQAVFPTGVSLSANTVYAFDGYYVLQKTSGTNTHTIGTLFYGSATLNNILYGITWTRDNSSATNPSGLSFSAYHQVSTVASSVTLTGFIGSAGQVFCARISGTVSINAAGTFVPGYILSAAPGGAYTTVTGSYFSIWPIGAAGANTSVGPWA